MMKEIIEEIYTDLRDNYIEDPNYVIEFYSKREFFFNNIVSFNNKEELKLYIEIIWQLSNATFIKC